MTYPQGLQSAMAEQVHQIKYKPIMQKHSVLVVRASCKVKRLQEDFSLSHENGNQAGLP